MTRERLAQFYSGSVAKETAVLQKKKNSPSK